MIEHLSYIHKISDLSDTVKSISIVTPPSVTEEIVDQSKEAAQYSMLFMSKGHL